MNNGNKPVNEQVKSHKEQMREFAEFIERNNLKKKGDAKNGKQ